MAVPLVIEMVRRGRKWIRSYGQSGAYSYSVASTHKREWTSPVRTERTALTAAPSSSRPKKVASCFGLPHSGKRSWKAMLRAARAAQR